MYKRLHSNLILKCSFLFVSLLPPQAALANVSSQRTNKIHQAPAIQVLIGRSLKNIVVSGKDIKRTIFETGNTKSHQGNIKVNFLCPTSLKKMENFIAQMNEGKSKNSRINASGKNMQVLLAQVDSPSGILSWNEAHYRGDLLVVKTPEQGCLLIHRSNIEDYISSLLAKEMNRNWPVEALKAQAVAARTYALFQMKQRKQSKKKGSEVFYDLENSEKDQVNGTMADESPSTIRAAQQTKGQVLLDPAGNLGPTFYHSKCGGKTLLPMHVWNKPEAGYVSVKCPYCFGHGSSTWNYTLESNEFKSFIKKYAKRGNLNMQDVLEELKKNNILFHPDRKENIFLRVNVDDQLGLLNKIYLRRFLGRDKIRSNNFSIKQHNNQVVITGEGNGHGVGMCQFGALAMADMGWDYKKILKYYYPRHELKAYY